MEPKEATQQPVVGNVQFGGDAPPPNSIFSETLGPAAKAYYDDMKAQIHGSLQAGAEYLADVSADDFLTPSQARAAREKREAGHVLSLKHTGGKALVRQVTLTDTAMIASLPDKLQRRVLQMINDLREVAETDTKPTTADGSLDVDKTIALLKGDAKTVDAFCLLGFLKPRLIVSEADRTHSDEVVLSDIDPRDRKAVFDWMQGRIEQEAAQIAPFPDRSPADVAAGGPGGVDGDPAVGLAELTLGGGE